MLGKIFECVCGACMDMSGWGVTSPMIIWMDSAKIFVRYLDVTGLVSEQQSNPIVPACEIRQRHDHDPLALQHTPHLYKNVVKCRHVI